VEGIFVLAQHDHRLHSVVNALERRLQGELFLQAHPIGEDEALNITGKGLDAIIEDVKKRTGLSQFLRGNHSSLDPFGSMSGEMESGAPAMVYNAAFQVVAYTHSPPGPNEDPIGDKSERKRLRKRHGQMKEKKKLPEIVPYLIESDYIDLQHNQSEESSKGEKINGLSQFDAESPPHLSFTISDSRVKPSAVHPSRSVTRLSKRRKNINASSTPPHRPYTRRSVDINKDADAVPG
jgi:hypothetical protein